MPDKTTKRRPPVFSINLDEELADQLRNTVWALSIHPKLRLTQIQLVENALRREIRRLERNYNKGKPFPPRPSQVKTLPAGRKAR